MQHLLCKLCAVSVLLALTITSAVAIKCYVPSDSGSGVIAAQLKDPRAMCMRYQFTCTPTDTACAKKDVGKPKWAYGIALASTCKTLKGQPATYSNVVCCKSNLCNAPDKKADPGTKVLPGEVQLTQETAVRGSKKPK